MDYIEKAQYLAETIAGLGFTTASESAARFALTEAHKEGLAEGEAKRAVETNNYIVQNGEIWGALAKTESQRKEAESKLSALEKKYEALVPDRDQAEASENCYRSEVTEDYCATHKRFFNGFPVCSIGGLNARLAAAEARADSLARELAKLTAESGRMREAITEAVHRLHKMATGEPSYSHGGKVPSELIKMAYDTLKSALSPEPEKCAVEEAEAKLYDTEVKRGQDIMEFEREKKALNAELAANEDWHKKYLRLQGDNCDLERELHNALRELAKLTAELAAEKAERETAEERGIFVDKRATDMAIEKDALAQELKGARTEAGRMREALEAAQEELKEGLAGGCNGSHAPTLSIVEDALSPEPEKPAPEGKPSDTMEE